MVRDYARGITPNPDVLCNRQIKFGHFYTWARKQGADMIATGHYARVVENNGAFELHRGKDSSKDQSYFLHQVKGADLAHVFFPVGDMEKSEVRRRAGNFDLPVAARPDSQGLCFVGDISLTEFLGRFIPLAPGPLVDTKGEKVGEHDGAALYTIGQRHGFRITKNGEPYYVTRIDLAKNAVIVSHEREDGAVGEVRVDDMHWIGDSHLTSVGVLAQTRYRETPVPVVLTHVQDSMVIKFRSPHIAAPGQSVVLFDGDHCLGGGTISPSKR
jgi:tRNA-specific 2-thiouridylase